MWGCQEILEKAEFREITGLPPGRFPGRGGSQSAPYVNSPGRVLVDGKVSKAVRRAQGWMQVVSGDFPGRGQEGDHNLLDFNLGCVKTALQSRSWSPEHGISRGLVGREKIGRILPCWRCWWAC